VTRPTRPRTGNAPRTGKPTEAEAWALLLTVTGLGPAGLGALLGEHGGGRAIDAGEAPGDIAAAWTAEEEAFRITRAAARISVSISSFTAKYG